ncbi:MAG: hypothetical protein WDN25_11310 [Acetobacteraceae bacterium]
MDEQSRSGIGRSLTNIGWLLTTAVAGVGVACCGLDATLVTASAGFIGSIAANLGTEVLGRLHRDWRGRARATDENHVIIRGLRAAQLAALHQVVDRFAKAWRTDHEFPGRGPTADRFERSLRAWLAREAERVPHLILDDTPAPDEADLARLRKAIVARLPDDFTSLLATRHGAAARKGFAAAAEAAVLVELCAALTPRPDEPGWRSGVPAWQPGNLPPRFTDAFYGEDPDGAGGWFALFIGEAAARLRAGGEFERIWNAEQIAVIRFMAEATHQDIAKLEQSAAAALQALLAQATTLDAIAGDAAAARAHAAATEDFLRRDRDLPLNLKSGLSTEGWLRFAAHNPAIRFRGRTTELAALRGFLDDRQAFRWWIVTGPGGAGKTRLGLELCLRAHADGWRGGFLRHFGPADAWSLSPAWRPAGPTLIIADYASEQVERISALARQLHEQATDPAAPVRLLLLERQVDPVFESRFLGSRASDEGAVRGHRYADTPLAVPDLGEDALWDMVRDCPWLDGRQVALSREAFFARLGEVDAARRPLVAMILAEASSVAPERGHFGTLEDELQALIRRDREHQWPASLGAAGKPIGAAPADALLAFASMVDGIDEAGLAACAPHCPAVADPDHLAACARAAGCHWDPARPRLERIEPDLIGEFFTLEVVACGVGSTPSHPWLAEQAWRTDEAAMAALVTRARQNFPDHSALRRIEITVPGVMQSWWLAALRTAGGADSLDARIAAAAAFLDPPAATDSGAARAFAWLAHYASATEAGTVTANRRRGLVDRLLALVRAHGDHPDFRRALASSLFNTLIDAKSEDDLSRRDALLDELRGLSAAAPDDAAVRERLAKGLSNTLIDAKSEDDLPRRDALLDELRHLSAAAPDDAAVREPLAMGLFNTLNHAKSEDDLSRRDALLDELRGLSAVAPDEAAVCGQLAAGLFNTLNDAKSEADLSRRDALLDELRGLSAAAPADAAVREELAKGLFNTLNDAKSEADLSRRDALLDELRGLSAAAPADAAVRELLAKGLFATLNHAKSEADLSRRDALLDELRGLSAAAPADAAVREELAKGLFNTLNDAKSEDDLSRRDALLDELRGLSAAAPDDAAVRERLAKGLFATLNHAKSEADLSRRDALLDELRGLSAAAPADAAVREELAKGLFNTLNDAKSEADLSRRDALLDELRGLSAAAPADAAVRELLAKGLFATLNHAKSEADLSRRDALLDELRGLSAAAPADAAVREELAKGLFNTLNDAKSEDDLSRRDALLDELRGLSAAAPDDAAVRERLAKGLFATLNHAKSEADLSRRDALLDELRGLSAAAPADAAVREELAKGLFNTLNDAKSEADLSRRDALLDELRGLSAAAPDDAAARQWFARGLAMRLNHSQEEGDLSRRDALLDELRALASSIPDDAAVRYWLTWAWALSSDHAREGGDDRSGQRFADELRALAARWPEDTAVAEVLRHLVESG